MLTEATSPDVRVRARISEKTVLLVASFGAFLAFLDATIVNVAFPNIRESFPDAAIATLSWILNAYSIVFAAFLVVSGRLADLLGRRRAFTVGVALFTVASVLCADRARRRAARRRPRRPGARRGDPRCRRRWRWSSRRSPPDRRSHAIGLWGASAALASGLGPPIGGALVELGDWRWAFMVNLPVRPRRALGRTPPARREPRARAADGCPTCAGAALSAAHARPCSPSASSRATDWGWTSPAVIACFVGSALLLVAFVVSSRRHRSPLLDPALLRIRPFVVGNIATIVAGDGLLRLPAHATSCGCSTSGATRCSLSGLAVVPGALVAAVLAAVLGPVAQKRGYRLVIVPGAIVWALAYVWYVTRVEVTPDFLGAWLPGQIISRHRRRRDAARCSAARRSPPCRAVASRRRRR